MGMDKRRIPRTQNGMPGAVNPALHHDAGFKTSIMIYFHSKAHACLPLYQCAQRCRFQCVANKSRTATNILTSQELGTQPACLGAGECLVW
ncbi:hypothetical protein QC761_0044850 [Podospora bellae-mahoneyi]|uniref:Uncharacterized protein n=1 Tax=Podospora bellae-mahoneyi TaxID=2093777 RepID=A0ABR0FUL6_9PEZI|nr:hypothetical protein QC761_0044850 [Podospora bellae-mahoneyi]